MTTGVVTPDRGTFRAAARWAHLAAPGLPTADRGTELSRPMPPLTSTVDFSADHLDVRRVRAAR